MKKLTLLSAALCVLLVSCASTDFARDQELVEYKDMSYQPENKLFLTEKELREDCDMLKYIVYNCYAGIDEAIDLGFDLDATIEDIYNQTLKKKEPASGLYPVADFKSITSTTFSKNLTNTDQHLAIARSIHDSITVYYSGIFVEKKDGKYIISESNDEKVVKGKEYTGPESNLFRIYTKTGEHYRYAIMTKKKARSAVISVENEKITINVEPDKPIPSKSNGTGLKTTDQTLYMSLGDCSQAFGIGDTANNFTLVWDNFVSDISKNMDGKKNIIFDMRSNPGGYDEYPARMLTAAYYYKHTDPEFARNMRLFFYNERADGMVRLYSPVTMQIDKNIMKKYWQSIYDEMNEETQEFYKTYWKYMKQYPVRTFRPLNHKNTTFTQFPEPDFKGNIYVLINSNSCSAAEIGTELSYFLQDQGINVTLVGENSWGGLKYVGMNYYYLPHSGLCCYLGLDVGESKTLQNIPTWKGEGAGFYPDYWATNDIILDTLIMLTGDEQLQETLKGLDKNQL